MRITFAVILFVHGLIHLMGPTKAFRFADLPQLTQPISYVAGLVWLSGAILFVAAAGALLVWPRWWWALGAAALLVSQCVIVSAWSDAKFGSVINAMALVGVAFGFLAHGPWSLRTQYERDVDRGLARASTGPVVTEADLAHLPEPVRRYLRVAGVLDQPRVRNATITMHGRIRSGPDAPWMPFTAEQHNFFDQPARFFYMNASRGGVPIQGLHRYVDRDATMLVKVAALVPVARASGLEMTQAETVTLFNDMCLLAPATLIDPAIVWEPVDPRTVRAAFTNAGHTIRAELAFNSAGELVDFRSDDRRQASADGTTMRAVRWSTPVDTYRAFAAVRLATRGEARWHEPSGAYAYIQIEIDDVRYNVRER